ncbi:hypothetical protein [Fodinicurvata sp. EGI_FJ10296]|uniref:hypothetical protein n=1 Tax=Fodinicurvata sp. EGI_FJ10296 TaxID=3231908 RepID=UPI00345575B7
MPFKNTNEPAPDRNRHTGSFIAGAAAVAVGAAISMLPDSAAHAETIQSLGLCGNTSADARFELAMALSESPWQISYQAGYVVAQGMAMAHPASSQVEQGSFEVTADGALRLIPRDPNGAMEVTFDWVDDELWSFDSEPSLPDGARLAPGSQPLPSLAVTDDELAVLTDCPTNSIPRLVGTGTTTMQGVAAEFVLRLLVVDLDMIYGFQEFRGSARGMTVVERRPFVMSSQ